jgi:predicted nucleic acid-binding protein
VNYKYIIDSSAWSAYFSGSEFGVRLQHVLEEGNVATSILAIAELADKYVREGKSFTNHLSFITRKTAVLPLSVAISLLGAELKKAVRKVKPKFRLMNALQLSTAKTIWEYTPYH